MVVPLVLSVVIFGPPEATAEADKWKKAELNNKNKGNISIPIRRVANDATYLSMDGLGVCRTYPVTEKIKWANWGHGSEICTSGP
jgi:hypothetical protein